MPTIIENITNVYKTIKKVPAQIANLSSGQLDTLANFARNPARFIRGAVVGFILSAIAGVVSPIFGAVQLLALGSAPAVFGARYETWGLADLPAVLADIVGDTLGATIGAGFDALTGLIAALVPNLPGPLDGLLGTALVVAAIVALVRIGGPTLRAALEAVPVVGGPLSTLLGELL